MFDIKIINSFNKKDNSQNKENTFSDASTLGNGNLGDSKIESNRKIENTSTNINSFTNDQELNSMIISEVNGKKSNSFVRDVIVGATGSVLGAIIYYILSVM